MSITPDVEAGLDLDRIQDPVVKETVPIAQITEADEALEAVDGIAPDATNYL